MSLKDKRKKLLNEWIKERPGGCERELIKQIFYEIEQQDKEAIKELKEELKIAILENVYSGDAVHHLNPTIDKIFGDKLI